MTSPSPSAQPARQLSLVAADMSAPGLEDLEGLLCGTGHVVRGIGAQADAARISVLVDDAWRVRALESRLAEMDMLDPSRPAATPGRPNAVSVRTRFDPRLLEMAARWTRGATPVAPAALHLDGPRLWWWAVSAGVADRGTGGRGIKLRLARSAPQRWTPVGAALAEAGVPGIFLGPRADGPAYRLVGTRRLIRLADLVGEAPDGAPPQAWPSSALEPRRSRLGGTRTLPAPTAAGDDRTAPEPPGTPSFPSTSLPSTSPTDT